MAQDNKSIPSKVRLFVSRESRFLNVNQFCRLPEWQDCHEMWSKMDRERKKKLQQQQIQEQLNASTATAIPASASTNSSQLTLFILTTPSLAPVPMDVDKEDGQV